MIGMTMIEGSLEVKLPTIWTEVGRVREQKKRSEKIREERRCRRAKKVGKSREIHCVFPMICGSGGSKNRLAKAADAEPAGQMRDEQLHVVVTRSTFRSQNVQSTPGLGHFWKLRCQKSVQCTPLCREAHFQVKMYKAHHARTTFDASYVVSRGRHKGLCTLSKMCKT